MNNVLPTYMYSGYTVVDLRYLVLLSSFPPPPIATTIHLPLSATKPALSPPARPPASHNLGHNCQSRLQRGLVCSPSIARTSY